MHGIFPSGRTLSPAVVELGTVIEVKPNYTVTVQTAFSHRQLTDVPWLTPALDAETFTGFDTRPVVGSMCYVLTPGDGSGPVVLGYTVLPANASEEGTGGADAVSYRATRVAGSPGDRVITTPGGQFVKLLSNKALLLGGGALCQVMYIPVDGLIRTMFGSLAGISPLGSYSWRQSATEEDADSSECVLSLDVLENQSAGSFVLEIRAGSLTPSALDNIPDLARIGTGTVRQNGLGGVVEQPAPSVSDYSANHVFASAAKSALKPIGVSSLSVVLRAKNSPTPMVVLQLSKEGSVLLVANNLHVELLSAHIEAIVAKVVAKELALLVESLSVGAGATELSLSKAGAIKASANVLELVGVQEVIVRAPKVTLEGEHIILAGSRVDLGRGANLPLVAGGDTLLDSIENHVHGVSGAATTVPTPPSTGNAVATDSTSTQVYVRR